MKQLAQELYPTDKNLRGYHTTHKPIKFNKAKNHPVNSVENVHAKALQEQKRGIHQLSNLAVEGTVNIDSRLNL